MAKERVAVLGASPNPARYANKAVKSLVRHGHEVVPVTPSYDEVEGIGTCPDLDAVEGRVDTLTVYIAPEKIAPHLPAIIAMRPGRVILNPGAEAEILMEALDNARIPYMKACTLVLLSTNQF